MGLPYSVGLPYPVKNTRPTMLCSARPLGIFQAPRCLPCSCYMNPAAVGTMPAHPSPEGYRAPTSAGAYSWHPQHSVAGSPARLVLDTELDAGLFLSTRLLLDTLLFGVIGLFRDNGSCELAVVCASVLVLRMRRCTCAQSTFPNTLGPRPIPDSSSTHLFSGTWISGVSKCAMP